MKNRAKLLILPIVTIILEMLPYGAVLNFANGEGETWRVTLSYFDMTSFGYANFGPFITAVLSTVVFALMVFYCVTGKTGVLKGAKVLLILAAAASFGPFMFGLRYVSAVGVLISISLIAQLVLLKLKRHND